MSLSLIWEACTVTVYILSFIPYKWHKSHCKCILKTDKMPGIQAFDGIRNIMYYGYILFIGGIFMAKKKKQKFYAIKEGFKKNIIVMTWAECKELTDHFPQARFHSFVTKQEAEDYLNGKPTERKQKPTVTLEKKGARLEVWISDPKIIEDLKKECIRFDLSVDKAIEELISKWIY